MTTERASAVVVENLEKRFGTTPALRGVSFAVDRAELLPRLGARFDALSQVDLVAFGQERMTADVDEVQVNQVFIVVRGVARCNHEHFPYSGRERRPERSNG